MSAEHDLQSVSGEAPGSVALDPLIVAFIQGAQWWEYHQTGATMWPSDRDHAEREAKKRLRIGTLGELLNSQAQTAKRKAVSNDCSGSAEMSLAKPLVEVGDSGTPTAIWWCPVCRWTGLDLTIGEAPEYHRRWNSKQGMHCPGNLSPKANAQ